MRFDDVLGVIGDFGTFQKAVFVSLCLPTIVIAMQFMSPVFIFATPNHRCAIPGLPNDTYKIQNSEHQALVQEYIPGFPDSMSTCDIYNITNLSSGNDTRKIPCHRWVYDKAERADSVVSELDLVCSKTIFKAHAQTAGSVGSLFGFLVMGPVSDRYGRKPMYLAEMVIVSAAGTALIWLPNIYVYIVIRSIGGFGRAILYSTLFIWGRFAQVLLYRVSFVAMEFIGPSKRMLCGILVNHFWALGLLLETGLAYGLRSWRHLQLAMTLPYIPFLLYYCLIPESPRFLIFKGKPEGPTVIKQIAKFNKVTLSDKHLDIEVEITESKGIKDIINEVVLMFKDRTLAVYSCVLFLNWFVNALIYLGLTLNVENLYGDMYTNFAISASMEVIAYTVSIPSIAFIGRKKYNCSCMLVAGFALFGMILIDLYAAESIHWMAVTCSMIGKLAVSGSFATIVLFSVEIFPTIVRNTALGLCGITGMVGYVVAPYIVDLALMIPGSFAKELPMLLFGVLAVLAGLATLVLPESADGGLPDTLEDMKKKSSKFPDIAEVEINTIS